MGLVLCDPWPQDVYLAHVVNGRYEVVSAVDVATAGGFGPFGGGELRFYDPVGEWLEELGKRIGTRSTTNCGESVYNSLGLPRNLVPPLTNELTSTGSPYEDSFAYYLNLADLAATEAYQASQLASEAEKDIADGARTLQARLNNIAADADDQIGPICGAGVDPEVGCKAPRVTVRFHDLGLLADSYSCNVTALPSLAPPYPTSDEIANQVRLWAQGQNRLPCASARAASS